MASVASTWSYDPQSVPWDDHLLHQLGLHPNGGADFFLGNLADSARFQFVPALRTTGKSWIGARLVPGLAVADCPLVIAEARDARTLASTARDGLAMALGEVTRSYAPHAWAALDADWPRFEGPISALDAAMGGSQATARLRELLDSARFRDLLGEERSGDALAPVWHQLRSTLDPDAGHRAMLDAARASVEQERVVEVSGDPGPFADAAASLGFVAEHLYERDTAGPERAWRVGVRTTSSDVFEPGGVRPDQPNGRRARGATAAARAVLERGGQATYGAHPLWNATEALATDGGYDGREHLAAAKVLEDQGEALLAWGAIECAAWLAVSLGKSSALPAFHAARALARRQDWHVITEHLDRIAAARDD